MSFFTIRFSDLTYDPGHMLMASKMYMFHNKVPPEIQKSIDDPEYFTPVIADVVGEGFPYDRGFRNNAILIEAWLPFLAHCVTEKSVVVFALRHLVSDSRRLWRLRLVFGQIRFLLAHPAFTHRPDAEPSQFYAIFENINDYYWLRANWHSWGIGVLILGNRKGNTNSALRAYNNRIDDMQFSIMHLQWLHSANRKDNCDMAAWVLEEDLDWRVPVDNKNEPLSPWFMPNKSIEEIQQLILGCGGAAKARMKFRDVLNSNFVTLSDGMVLSINNDKTLNLVFADSGWEGIRVGDFVTRRTFLNAPPLAVVIEINKYFRRHDLMGGWVYVLKIKLLGMDLHLDIPELMSFPLKIVFNNLCVFAGSHLLNWPSLYWQVRDNSVAGRTNIPITFTDFASQFTEFDKERHPIILARFTVREKDLRAVGLTGDDISINSHTIMSLEDDKPTTEHVRGLIVSTIKVMHLDLLAFYAVLIGPASHKANMGLFHIIRKLQINTKLVLVPTDEKMRELADNYSKELNAPWSTDEVGANKKFITYEKINLAKFLQGVLEKAKSRRQNRISNIYAKAPWVWRLEIGYHDRKSNFNTGKPFPHNINRTGFTKALNREINRRFLK
jgi:hypothetical protein